MHPHLEWRQGHGTRCCPQRRRDRYSLRSFFPLNLDPFGGEPCKSIRYRVRSVFHLYSLVIFHLSSSPSPLFLEALGAISRSFGDRVNAFHQAPRRVLLARPHRPCTFAPSPQLWIPLLMMSITGHRQWSRNTVIFPITTTSSSASMRSTA